MCDICVAHGVPSCSVNVILYSRYVSRPTEDTEVTSPVVSALIPFFISVNNSLPPQDKSQ